MTRAQRGVPPVPISTSNGGTGATLVWRRQGRLYLTAVVKATFTLVPGGTMTPVPPEPIASDEQEHAGGLRTAGDLVPFRSQADVLVTGHTFAPPGLGRVPVRLSVVRDGATVLDKALTLQVPAGSSTGQVRLFGLGPLSRHWPVRRRMLGDHAPQRFEGEAIDLPAAFDESYFQAAPIDQRLDNLRGDEQIVFEGASPDGAPIETRLPGVRAAAHVHGPWAELGGMRPLHLVMDTLHVDLDLRICNVTWRGVTPVVHEDELASVYVVATVERADGSPAPEAPLEVELAEEDLLDSTMALSPEAALPVPATAPGDGATQVLSLDLLQGAPPPADAPQRSLPPPLPPPRPPPPASAKAMLPPPKLPPRRDAPGVPAAPLPGRLSVAEVDEHPLDSTLTLHGETHALAAPATPFEATAPAPIAPPALLAPQRHALPEPDAAPRVMESPPSSMPAQSLAAAPPEPISEVAPAPVAPVWLGPPVAAVRAEETTFGAHFLAAMELFDARGDRA